MKCTTRFTASSLPLAIHLLVLATPAAGQRAAPAAPPPADGGTVFADNDAPSVTTSLPARGLWCDADVMRFTVTVTDADGDNVSVKLLDPPLGLTFEPVADRPSPVTVEVLWVARSTRQHRFHFEASDGKETVVVPVEVEVLREDLIFQLGSKILVGDVTGDGVTDVVAGAPNADVEGVSDTGAVYVWAGTSSPTGTPSAKLTVPGAVAGDRLSEIDERRGQEIQLADVTGDGVLDVVVATQSADVTGTDTGAVYLWKGGTGLASAGASVAPDATLAAPSWFQEFGRTDKGQSVLLEEVTGDAWLDVIVASSYTDVGGVVDAGAILVWSGGPALSGTLAPTATLTVPGAVTGDRLAYTGGGQGIQVADVTGDGVLDLVAKAVWADIAGVTDTGAIYVWSGGASLEGSVGPSGTLTVPGAATSDKLGYGLGDHLRMQLADVSGDGLFDVVAGSVDAEVEGVPNVGAVYVWVGGAGVSGASAPTATLTDTTAGDAELTSGGDVPILLVDLTGDGVLDLLVSAIGADLNGFNAAGAVYLWAGGPALSGTPTYTARLQVPGARSADLLGVSGGQSMLLADLDGDGKRELVIGAYSASVNGLLNSGAVYVWSGATPLVGRVPPTGRLAVPPGVVAPKKLGFVLEQGIQLADVSGDGLCDVVVGHRHADVDGVRETGALHVWRSEDGFQGTSLWPSATLIVPGAGPDDWMETALLAEVTGDGVLDVLSPTSLADPGGADRAGAIYLWEGGPALQGYLAPTTTLTRTVPAPLDFLSGTPYSGLQFADLTGSGVLDVVAGARGADTNSQNEGVVLLWRGGPGLVDAPGVTAELQSPGGGAPDDSLSNWYGSSFPLADITGDGVCDLIAGAAYADVGGVEDTGAIQLWSGGPGLAGIVFATASLTVPGASAFDLLGTE